MKNKMMMLAATALLALPVVATVTSCANNPTANALLNAALDQAQVELDLRKAEYESALALEPATTPEQLAARNVKLARLNANVQRAEAALNSLRKSLDKNPLPVQPVSASVSGPPRWCELAFTFIDYSRIAALGNRPPISVFTRPDGPVKLTPPKHFVRKINAFDAGEQWRTSRSRFLT